MIDNFVQEQPYHSWDRVYTHPLSKNGIYIGDLQSANDPIFISQQKIKTVVTAAKDMDHIAFDEQVLHITYPLLDGKHQNIASFFDSFYEVVENNINKGGLLVHCAAGISRSSTLVISYIMKKQSLGFKDAIALVRKSRPNVLPNLGFQRQLKKYQQNTLRKHQVVSRNNDKPQARPLSNKLIIKTQHFPALNMLNTAKHRFKNCFPNNTKLHNDKISEKDVMVMRIYNRPQNQAAFRSKRLVASKKSSSFSKNKGLQVGPSLSVNYQGHFSQFQAPSTVQEKRSIPRPKNSMQQLKQIYLARRQNLNIDRRLVSDRGATIHKNSSQHRPNRL